MATIADVSHEKDLLPLQVARADWTTARGELTAGLAACKGTKGFSAGGIPGDGTSCKTNCFELCLKAVSFPKGTQLLLLEAIEQSVDLSPSRPAPQKDRGSNHWD